MDTAKERLLNMMKEMSEEDAVRVLNFAAEIRETNQKDLEDHAPVAFWDNDDKVWNEISR